MDNLIVGGKECSLNTVLSTIEETPPEITPTNIKEIMKQLDTPPKLIIQLCLNISEDKMDRMDALHEILNDWVTRRSAEASLKSLVDTLNECDLNSRADALKTKLPLHIDLESEGNDISSEMIREPSSNISYDCQYTTNSSRSYLVSPDASEIIKVVPSRTKCQYCCLVLKILGLVLLFLLTLSLLGGYLGW